MELHCELGYFKKLRLPMQSPSLIWRRLRRLILFIDGGLFRAVDDLSEGRRERELSLASQGDFLVE